LRIKEHWIWAAYTLLGVIWKLKPWVRTFQYNRKNEHMRRIGISGVLLAIITVSCWKESGPDRSEGFWEVNNTRLHYVIESKGDPIVVLHGGPGGNLTSKLELVSFAPNYQWVFYDQRGCGESDRFPVDLDTLDEAAELFSIENYIKDLEEIRLKLGFEELTLFGHSWGGALAVFYAAAHPTRVKKLIVYNGGPMWPELQVAKRAALRSRTKPEINDFVKELTTQIGDNIELWEQTTLDSAFIEMIALFITAYNCHRDSSPDPDKLGLGGFWANQLTNRYIKSFDRESFAKKLAQISSPTLITYGCCEVNPPERQTFLRDAIPNSKMVIFEESGHNAHLEQPDLFGNVLRAFLNDEILPLEEYRGTAAALKWSETGIYPCME